MEIAWSIDPELRLVRLKYRGSADYPAWEKTMLEIFSHPDYRPGFGFIANLADAEVPDQAHLRQVSDFVAAHQEQLAGSRWANVTTQAAHYGMTRMAQVFVEGSVSPLQVFDSEEKAERWATGREEAEESGR